MITEIKKGNKATYNGYLLGKREYDDYMMLKELIPDMVAKIRSLGEDE